MRLCWCETLARPLCICIFSMLDLFNHVAQRKPTSLSTCARCSTMQWAHRCLHRWRDYSIHLNCIKCLISPLLPYLFMFFTFETKSLWDFTLTLWKVVYFAKGQIAQWRQCPEYCWHCLHECNVRVFVKCQKKVLPNWIHWMFIAVVAGLKKKKMWIW